jgi:hypothetical protein
MYETLPQEASVQGIQMQTPGLKTWGAASSTGCRLLYTMDSVLYAVYETTLYSIDSNGTATALGTIGGGGKISAADNGFQLVLVASAASYVYSNVSTTLTQITATNFLAAGSVAYLDGFFTFTQLDTNQFFVSGVADSVTGLVDFSTFDATERAFAYTQAGYIQAVISDHKELWIFKTRFIEIWQNSGEADFPLSRLGGAYIERGCINKHAIAQADNSIFWLGDDRVVYRANGYVPQRISTFAVEAAISDYTVTDCFAQSWDEAGHKLFGLWFPTSGATWVYDIATDMWHERQSFGYGYWRANQVAVCYGKTLVGDSESASIGELDYATFTEYGNMIQAIRVGHTIQSEGNMFSLDRLEIVIESGVGLLSGQGSAPVIGLQISKDFGRTYGTLTTRSMGAMGEYSKRAVWRQLGTYRQFTPRLLITDPVRRYILDSYAEITPRRV